MNKNGGGSPQFFIHCALLIIYSVHGSMETGWIGSGYSRSHRIPKISVDAIISVTAPLH